MGSADRGAGLSGPNGEDVCVAVVLTVLKVLHVDSNPWGAGVQVSVWQGGNGPVRSACFIGHAGAGYPATECRE